jgi:hypothetical protein
MGHLIIPGLPERLPLSPHAPDLIGFGRFVIPWHHLAEVESMRPTFGDDRPIEGEPVNGETCPECGSALVRAEIGKRFGAKTDHMVRCTNRKCGWSEERTSGEGWHMMNPLIKFAAIVQLLLGIGAAVAIWLEFGMTGATVEEYGPNPLMMALAVSVLIQASVIAAVMWSIATTGEQVETLLRRDNARRKKAQTAEGTA